MEPLGALQDGGGGGLNRNPSRPIIIASYGDVEYNSAVCPLYSFKKDQRSIVSSSSSSSFYFLLFLPSLRD